MNVRPTRHLLAVAVLAACGVLTWYFVSPPAPVARGPIILISIDTLRADRLPAYGYDAGRTPAIDAFVRDSILFERMYTHSPLTLPAHVSMLTGQLPHEHGVRDNIGFTVDERLRLLPEWLRERGYATAGVVSSAVLRAETGLGGAFDFFDSRMPPARGGAALDEAQRDGLDSLTVARDWIQQRPRSAWFLFFHLYEPHAPYQPPSRHGGLKPYDGEVAYADEIVGRLLEDLRARGVYDQATIVLLSDHGEGLGDHGEQEHGLFLYEEAVRVPFIVKLAGGRHAGGRVRAVVQHVDLLPTLLDLANLSVPDNLPGRSLRPLLERRSERWTERSVYAEALFGRYHFGWSEIFSLTDSRYRFIQAPRPELYDLQVDPRERQNLIETRAQTARAMADALSRFSNDGVAVAEPQSLAPDIRDRLASLGYVGPQTGARAAASIGDRADPKDKVHVLSQYRTAMAQVADGRLDEAIAQLRQIGREEPGMSDVWLTVGRLRLRQGRGTEAVRAFQQYVRAKPTSVAGLLELSAALLSLERISEAVAHAELATAVARERADRLAAHEMLTRVALARRDSAAARRHGASAGEVDATFPLSDYVEGRLAYDAGRFGDAVRFFERAIQASRSSTLQIRGLHLYAGDALAHVGRFADAEREFREEIRLFPESTFAYLSLANLYQAFGRIGDADQVLSAMLRAVPSPQAHAAARKLQAARAAAGEKH